LQPDPITVAQYQCFANDGGYDRKNCWTEAGWNWRTHRSVTGPENYGEVYQTPNHPRTGVSWFEAVAFCNWLSERTRLRIVLPTESEWERAARGTNGQKYPWGDQEDCQSRCNMGETGIDHTTVVGLFPKGNAPCGAADMAGNVWEWCQTKWIRDYEGYVYEVRDNPDGDFDRVLRGGAFTIDPAGVRCSFRDWYGPGVRREVIGFRLAAEAD